MLYYTAYLPAPSRLPSEPHPSKCPDRVWRHDQTHPRTALWCNKWVDVTLLWRRAKLGSTTSTEQVEAPFGRLDTRERQTGVLFLCWGCRHEDPGSGHSPNIAMVCLSFALVRINSNSTPASLAIFPLS